MTTYKVEGWYRYRNGDEKDIVVEYVEAESATDAIVVFEKMFNRRFFSVVTV